MFKHLFLDHPSSVGETYREHQKMALGFAFRLIAAGLACAVHGFVPALFTRAGSRAVEALYRDMVEHRARPASGDVRSSLSRAR